MRLVKADNGLEAWRRLVKKFDPQNAEVHAAHLEAIVTFGTRNCVKSVGDVPTVLDQFQRLLDDYEEVTNDTGINDSTKKTIIMQLLPQSLRVATRDTLMAARQTFVSVSPDYLRQIIDQRCDFDDAALGSAIPMDAGAVEQEDAGSLGQRGVGPGLGKGGGYRAPAPPMSRQLPPGGTLGWEKYDKWSNNGFPPNTCGGCGAEDHYRNDCPQNPNKGKYPPRKGKDGDKGGGKAKGKGKGKWGKGKWGKGVGGVDGEWAEEATREEDDGRQADEGLSVFDEDDDPD